MEIDKYPEMIVACAYDQYPKTTGGPGAILTTLAQHFDLSMGDWPLPFEVAADLVRFVPPTTSKERWRVKLRRQAHKALIPRVRLEVVTRQRIDRAVSILDRKRELVRGAGLVHAHDVYTFAALRRVRDRDIEGPRVLTIHSGGTDTRETAGVYHIDWKGVGKFPYRTEANAVRDCDVLLLPSVGSWDAIESDLATVGIDVSKAREKLEVIYNGIPDVSVGEEEVASLSSELGLQEDSFVILCVGRLRPEKGADLLIKSLRRVREALGDERRFDVLIAGQGAERKPLEDLAAAEGASEHVHFLGQRSDVAALLIRASVMCSPGRRAGFDLAILESFRAGRPVVCTRVGGNPEAVTSEGIVVEPEDPDAIGRALGALGRDPQRTAVLGRQARETFEAKYAEDVMVERYHAFYSSLLPARAEVPT